MANGWTGGQYSVYRVVLAAAVAVQFGAVGSLAALPLALGAADRAVALAFAVCAALMALVSPSAVTSAGAAAVALLALHTATPGWPYGSWGARGRVDPGAGWWLPPRVLLAARVLLGLAVVAFAVGRIESLGALWAPLLLLSLDPAWIPPRRDGAPARLFYDGECGLCHAAVRFVLAEDRNGTAFRFAPLASDSFARLAPPELRATLPDSIVLVPQDGRLLVRSAATQEIGERLGGLWRAFSRAGRVLPEAWRDASYDTIARNRKRFVRRPEAACPLVPPELRGRFDGVSSS